MPTKKIPKTQKMDGLSADVGQEKLDALKQLVPEIFSDGKIDAEKLKRVVGENNVAEDERYRLEWAGKSEVFDEIAKRSACTLTLDEKRSSKDWEKSNNIFIEGENLEVLRMLQKAYHGKVKMIYIDPPYNTGKDFVYNDNFRVTEEEYCDDACNVDENGNIKKALKLNSKDNGRFHSNWLSMIYPRLYMARNLLREDGVIFVSIDDNEIHNLQMVMNEVFGEENFVGRIVSINNLKGRNDKKNLSTINDYLLIYQKSSSFETYGLPLSDEQIAEYKFIDEVGEKYKLRDLRKRGRPDRREDRPNMYFPIYFNQKLKTVSLKRIDKDDVKITPLRGDGSDGRWRWGKEKVSANLVNLHPKYNKKKDKWGVEHRVYLSSATNEEIPGMDDLDEDEELSEETRSRVKSVWMGGEFSTDVGRREMKDLFSLDIGFDYPKPTALIERCIQLSAKNDDIIIDFFSGSGTTAHSVMAQNANDGGNRKYICVQMPEETPEGGDARKAGYKKISDIAIDRIKKSADKIRKQHPEFIGDLGVRVYKETDSNFPQWHARAFESDEALKQAMIDYGKASVAGSAYDRATEVLLKLGYPLTTPLEEKKGYLTTPDGIALVLDSAMTIDGLKKVLSESPKTIVVLEKLFKKDEDKINFGLRCKESGVIFQTI